MKKKNDLLLASIGISAISAIGVSVGVLAYSYNYFRKKFDSYYGKNELDSIEDVPYDYQWLNEYKTKELTINSFDNLKLYGLSIKANKKTNKWVIMVHGYKSLGMMMINRAHEFVKEGFNVLLIDQRCCGKSEGRYITYGWLEHYDVLDWINLIVNKDKDAKIVLYGFSLGGATVMNVAGEYLVDNVKCIIEDAGYSSLKDILAYQRNKKYKSKGIFVVPGLDYLLKSKCGFSINDANSLRQLQQSVTPIMFIHGEEDKNVPYEMVFDNYYACNSEKELFTVSNANHHETIDNKYYYERIFRFIDRFI